MYVRIVAHSIGKEQRYLKNEVNFSLVCLVLRGVTSYNIIVERRDRMRELDIHGMYVKEAKYALDTFIDNTPATIGEIRVIHGYRNGTSLQSFVRKQYKHPRIVRSMLCLNPGETTLILKHKQKGKDKAK